MKKILNVQIFSYLFILFFCFPQSFRAQHDIKWSELMPHPYFQQIFLDNQSDFYTVDCRRGFTFASLTKYSKFKAGEKKKITSKQNEIKGLFAQIILLNDVPVAFISDKTDGKNNLYIQRYTNTCQPASPPKQIASYDVPKGWKRKGQFWIRVSENKEFFVLDYEIPGSKEEKELFGYKVFNTNLEVISQGEYILPYDSEKMTITNNYLSNSGDYFLAAKIYKPDETKKTFKKTRVNLDKIVVMHAKPNGLEEFELQLEDGKYISDLSFSSDKNRTLTLTGLYSDNKQIFLKGLFFIKLDFDSKELIQKNLQEFSNDFIVSEYTDEENEEAEKNKKRRGEPQLFEYDIRNAYTLDDGSTVGVLEQYIYREFTYTNSKGGQSTTTYYNYNDLIVYKINKTGGFDWVKKIKKSQYTINDGGTRSSAASFSNNEKLTLIFNDNIHNYNENGLFIENNHDFQTHKFKKKTNAVVKAEVDLASGDIKRRTFFDQNDVTIIAHPKDFVTNYSKKEMLIYFSQGKKVKFGILSY